MFLFLCFLFFFVFFFLHIITDPPPIQSRFVINKDGLFIPFSVSFVIYFLVRVGFESSKN